MKRGLIILILLIVLPFVNADVNLLNEVKDVYNLNEKIPLTLSVNSNQNLDGFLVSNVECENKVLDYYVTPVNLNPVGQKIEVPSLTLTKSMLGKCNLNIKLLDQEFSLLEKINIKNLEVSDLLLINVNLAKTELSPGEKLELQGTLKNVRAEDIKSGDVKVTIDNLSYIAKVDNGKFGFLQEIQSNIKSKNHNVNLLFEDVNGNRAEKDLIFYITPKPSSLKNLVNKLEFLPEETLTVEAVLYDQANDLLDTNAEIKVYNSNNDLITQGYNEISLTLTKNSKPGDWLIKTKDGNFNIESKIRVKEKKGIDFNVKDGILYIENTGNIHVDEVMDIVVGDQIFKKRINLNPGEAKLIELSDSVREGTYDVNVVADNKRENFAKVQVPKSDGLTGYVVQDYTNSVLNKPWILAILLFLIISFFFAKYQIKRNQERKRQKEYQLGNTRLYEITKTKGKEVKFKPKKFSELDESELRDYRKQLLDNMKREKQEKGKGQVHKQEDSNLFGMFK